MDLSALHASFDAITREQLVAAGSAKWTAFPDAIGAFVAEMDFGLAPAVRESLVQAVDRGATGYLPRALTGELAAATTAWYADRYGVGVDPARVHPLPDVLAGAELAIRHFSAPGAPVIVPTPAYMPFLTLPGALGREVIQVPCTVRDGRSELDLNALAAAFAAGGDLVLLCNPWNPIGRVLTRDELLALSAVVEAHGGRVFADEIHAPLVYGETRHVPYASVSPEAARHTVTATSVSKAFNLPGLKCAQLILHNDEDQARFEQIGMWSTHGASTPGVLSNIAAYREGGEWLDGVLQYLDGNRRTLRDRLADLLPQVSMLPIEGTYIAWLDVRALGLSEPAADFFLREAGVAMTDGAACGEAGEGHVRFVFATPRPILIDAVQRMADAVRRR
ncbi:MalY/PatB family protein [uncultured Amnibacterium sp.]|uniref:MalY/PatB family protein n=1 Tax=uncultured Amnibacterium sp. TaxID=1631851 RepID=UPI0035C95EFD